LARTCIVVSNTAQLCGHCVACSCAHIKVVLLVLFVLTCSVVAGVLLYRYETWRRHRLAGPRFGTRLKRFAVTTVLPVAAALYAAQRGINVKQVQGRKLIKLDRLCWALELPSGRCLLVCCSSATEAGDSVRLLECIGTSHCLFSCPAFRVICIALAGLLCQQHHLLQLLTCLLLGVRQGQQRQQAPAPWQQGRQEAA
jgi:hypothetical protein